MTGDFILKRIPLCLRQVIVYQRNMDGIIRVVAGQRCACQFLMNRQTTCQTVGDGGGLAVGIADDRTGLRTDLDPCCVCITGIGHR